MSIADVEALSLASCEAVVARLHALRSHWVDRSTGGQGTFFTLGRAAYLDVSLPGADPDGNYYRLVPASNVLLLEGFPELYERLCSVLEAKLAAPVRLATELAVPGFHIFVRDGIARAGQAGSHFDMQYLKLRLSAAPDDCPPISFTLPLRLPACGSGLEVWNVLHDHYDSAIRRGHARSLQDYASRKVSAYHAYTPGVMALIHDLPLHRISTPGPLAAGDERITLQGHGLRFGGEWLLYW